MPLCKATTQLELLQSGDNPAEEDVDFLVDTLKSGFGTNLEVSRNMVDFADCVLNDEVALQALLGHFDVAVPRSSVQATHITGPGADERRRLSDVRGEVKAESYLEQRMRNTSEVEKCSWWSARK